MRVGEAAERAGTLHVTNGESVANTLRQTTLGGSVLAWDDVLYEGPVPALARRELLRLRARFLAEAGWGTATTIRAELERRDELFTSALAEGPVVLWFEHDLYDQLQLLDVLALVGDRRPELICVGTFPGRPDFHGLGELTAAELETLWPLRVPVEDAVLATAAAAWDAFRSPDPGALEAFVAAGGDAVPFLRPALRRLIEELPGSWDGLSRSERQLLEVVAEGPRRPREIFLASQEREEAPFDGDAWVWRRLAALEGLVAPAGGGRVPLPPPRADGRLFAATSFELTGEGRAVLAGRADRVELLGLDRWLGGTHLTRENDWRWDGTSVSRAGL